MQDVITLDVESGGHLIARSVVEDYMLRGNELEHFSIMDFVVNTYKERKSGRQLKTSCENTGPG